MGQERMDCLSLLCIEADINLLRSVDFDGVMKHFALAVNEKDFLLLCTALQLQMYANYALDWYQCKTVFGRPLVQVLSSS